MVNGSTSFITFPFFSAILSFLILAIIMMFLNYKISKEKNIIVESKWMILSEMFFDFFSNIIEETVGEKYIQKFTPLAVVMFLSIFIGNSLVLFGFQEAATDIMFPLTWAMSMFIFWNVYGIYKIGIKGFIADFFKPMWWLFPMEIIGFLTKPLTLMIRMFGNIVSGFIMMGLILSVPALLSGVSDLLGIAGLIVMVPVVGVLSMYFSIFMPFIQAMVFTYLTFVNMSLLINEEE